MPATARQLAGRSRLDISLYMKRLEEALMAGDVNEKWLAALNRSAIWGQLETERQMQWARLAQMAGQVETALAVLAHLNRQEPENLSAWKERLNLLAILDDRPGLAQALALAQQALPATAYQELRAGVPAAAGASASSHQTGISALDAAGAPFEALRRHQAGLETYLARFAGREDSFARQWVDRAENKAGYVPVRRPMQLQDVEDHLRGHKTYGIYLLRSDATITTAVLDVDLAPAFRAAKVTAAQKAQVHREKNWLLRRIQELGTELKLPPLVEFSGGKGFHFWFFLAEPVPAARVRRLLEPIRQQVAGDVSAFTLELFPKQDQLTGKGFGNLVKLGLSKNGLLC